MCTKNHSLILYFRTNLVERSNEMIEELIKFDVGAKPIVWVGHSKGGLYIKQIILSGMYFCLLTILRFVF